MDTINIYIKEFCDSMNTKKGGYTAIIEFIENRKRIYNEYNDTTNYRMIIQGSIDAISTLEKSYEINLYTNTTFGMSKIKDAKGNWKSNLKDSAVNIDLLSKLKEVIIENGHQLNNFYDKNKIDTVVAGNKSNGVLKRHHNKKSNNGKRFITAGVSDELYNDFKIKSRGLPEDKILSFIIANWTYSDSSF